MIELTKENVLAELFEPKGNPRSLYFKQSAYNRWAVEEIFKYINEHPEMKTLMAIEEFIKQLNKYAYNSASCRMQWIFSVAIDMAEYLRDWCIAEEFK